MTHISEETRAQFKALKARAADAYAAAEPQRQAYREAMQPHYDVINQMVELVGDVDVLECESCSEPIFDADKRYYADEGGVLCSKCAPTYADLLANPKSFLDGVDDLPMTPERAKAVCDAHVGAGGSLTDKMAF
jgi:hypothetical protein